MQNPKRYLFYCFIFVFSFGRGQENYGAAWTCLGPFQLPTQTNGFVSSFYSSPNQGTILAGSLNGGLWKGKRCENTDTCFTLYNWENITDTYPLPGVGVNAVEVRPNTNLQTIYIGTQFSGNAREFNYSNGILKTTDGGKSWKQIGPPVKISDYKSVDYFKMNKENPDVMIAKIGKEIFLTGDDWKTFSVLDVPVKNKDGRVQLGDIEWKPGDMKTIYVTTRCESDIKSEFYITRDGGKTWSDEKHGIKASNIQLDVVNRPGLENYIFMAYGDPTISIQIYDGKKWSADRNIYPFGHMAGSVYWNFEFDVNDVDTSVMYSSTTQLSKSTDGGRTWKAVTEYFGASTHADIRDMQILKSTEKGKEDVVVLGNDGGVSISQPGVPGVAGWINANGTGLCISQFWGFATSETDPELIMGGGQDNGMYTFHNGVWKNQISGIGDGYDVCISDVDPKYAIGQGNSPSLCITVDGGDSWRGTQAAPTNATTFCRPMCMDKKNHKLYLGHHELFMKNNENGKLDAKWEQRSFIPEIKGAGNNLLNNTIKAIAISEKNGKTGMIAYSGPLWGKDSLKGKLFFCSDLSGGKPEWKDVTKFCEVLNWKEVIQISSDPSNENKYFLVISDVYLPTASDVYQVEIMGNADSLLAKNISFNLTKYPKNKTVVENNKAGTIYAATDSGVYFSNAKMLEEGRWEFFQDGEKKLPFCNISDMEINYSSNRLLIATYGRGIWYSPLAETGSENTIRIKKNTVFAKATKIDGELIVSAGKTLTITAPLYISSKAKITLKKKSKLIIQNNSGKNFLMNSDGNTYDQKKIVKGKNALIETLTK